MSRSFKKNPICGHTMATSEKKDKRIANRTHRRINKTRINSGQEPLELREVSDPWGMDKDGKQRFDPKEHPKLMKK